MLGPLTQLTAVTFAIVSTKFKCTLTLSQTTDFGLFQTGWFCRRQFKIWWKWQKVFQMDRRHYGKRRNCAFRAISPFPIVFSKDLYYSHVKTRDCFGKGLNLNIFILHRLRNKFFQLILISLDSERVNTFIVNGLYWAFNMSSANGLDLVESIYFCCLIKS